MALCSVLKVGYMCVSKYVVKTSIVQSYACVYRNVRRFSHCPTCVSQYSFREYSTLDSDEKKPGDPSAPKKKKTPIIPKITLFDPDDKMSVVTFEEAEQISERRGLKLIKIADADSKSGRATFKLLTKGQFLEVNKKKKVSDKKSTGFKGEKTVNVASKIGENDLLVKTNNIIRWVSKNYQVRVVVSGNSSDMGGAEKVYTYITSQLKNKERAVQKIIKGSILKFQVLPPKKEKEAEDVKLEEKEETQDENLSSNDENDNEEEEDNKTNVVR